MAKNISNVTGIRLNDDDRKALAIARKILESENNGVRFSIGAIFRAVLYYFVNNKSSK